MTLRTALLAGLAALCPACASSNSENRVNIREDGHDVFEGNSSLMRDLMLEDVKTRRVDNEFLEFQATLSNATDSDLRFQWLVEWYDRQGFKLHDPAETWHHAILNGKGELALRRVSPTANAARAKVRVMPVDQVQ